MLLTEAGRQTHTQTNASKNLASSKTLFMEVTKFQLLLISTIRPKLNDVIIDTEKAPFVNIVTFHGDEFHTPGADIHLKKRFTRIKQKFIKLKRIQIYKSASAKILVKPVM